MAKKIHVLDSFEFEYGRVLENVNVEYSTFGTPKYDSDGYIINAILYSQTFEQKSFIQGSHDYLEKNSNFDFDDFFFIIITPLGSPNSCSPSTTGLKSGFPKYSYKDIVNCKRQFLAEKFKIKKILGLIGEGLGGFETFTWACEYPDEMEFIFVLNSSYKISGYRYILAKGMENILDISDDFYKESYSTSLSKMLIAANTFIFAHTASKRIFDNISNDEIDVLMEDFIDECLFSDIYDFKFRNDCILSYDLEDKISDIKAKTLVLATNNNYFEIELDTLPLEDLIDDCLVLTHEPLQENYYFVEEDYTHLGKDVIDFIEQFRK